MKKNKNYILNAVILILSVVLTAGVMTLFRGCGVHDDGNYSTCHWAQYMVAGLGAVLTLQSLMLLVINNRRTCCGISMAMIPVAILAAVIPGRVIPLCMMESMRCHQIMKSAVLVVSGAITVASIVEAVLSGIGKDTE